MPSPRGTGVRGQWLKQLDLSARYTVPLGLTDRRRVVLRADVFNVFNGKAIVQRYSTAVTGTCVGSRSAAVPTANLGGANCGGAATASVVVPCTIGTPGDNCPDTGVFAGTRVIAGEPGYIPDPLFNTAQAYQQPRYVRLGLDLFWGGETAPVAEPAFVAPPPPPPMAPATQTCPDGSVILATDACPAPPPPPPPPAPEPERG